MEWSGFCRGLDVPLLNFYIDMLSMKYEYQDWAERLICICMTFFLSPFLLYAGYRYVLHFASPLVQEFEGVERRGNVWVALLCFIIAGVSAFVIVRLPGADMMMTERYPNVLGIKSSLILLSEVIAVGGVLGRGVFEIRRAKE